MSLLGGEQHLNKENSVQLFLLSTSIKVFTSRLTGHLIPFANPLDLWGKIFQSIQKALAALREKKYFCDFLIVIQRVIIFRYSTRNYISFFTND